ncbi:hypothetical protein F3Y22_tig00110465pilonHSYRG00008 [Hibiscus syriacus]|uniref:Uncharacterized protein n=1 Tax=Hibiscus syriacus TaxID=106335 RepID=A0A6A3AGM0_HIBSY|nr:hypothetical protein F3Y22_tig00110465pilonHSYRG00008 [Hibiscus syriacus]
MLDDSFAVKKNGRALLRVMLRNRYRAVTSNKQALMADHGSQSPSSQKNLTSPTPSFLCSPRFKAFIAKKLTEAETLEKPKGIALAIVDTLKDISNLRVQIPLIPPSPYGTTSPKSPGDFGIKTRNARIPSSPFGVCMKDSPRIINGRLPVEEMELSEDYT